MRKHYQIAAIIVLAIPGFLLSSCSTPQFSVVKTATYTGRDMSKNTYTETPMVADVEVEEIKITGSYEGKNYGTEKCKEMAVANALRKADAEVLVQPVYRVEVRNYTNISVNVEGFPGKYVNFRTPNRKDSLILGLAKPRKEPPPQFQPNPNGDNYFYNINLKPSSGYFPEYPNNGPIQQNSLNQIPTRSVSQTDNDAKAIDALAQERFDYWQGRYNAKKTSARTFTGLGSVWMGLGTIFLVAGSAAEIEPLRYSSFGLLPLGGIFTLIGIGNHLSAQNIKNQAGKEGFQIAVSPAINPKNQTYMANISIKF